MVKNAYYTQSSIVQCVCFVYACLLYFYWTLGIINNTIQYIKQTVHSQCSLSTQSSKTRLPWLHHCSPPFSPDSRHFWQNPHKTHFTPTPDLHDKDSPQSQSGIFFNKSQDVVWINCTTVWGTVFHTMFRISSIMSSKPNIEVDLCCSSCVYYYCCCSILFLPMVPSERGSSDGYFPFSFFSTPQTFGCKHNICGPWVLHLKLYLVNISISDTITPEQSNPNVIAGWKILIIHKCT